MNSDKERRFEVLLEEVRSKLDLVAEGHGILDKKIETQGIKMEEGFKETNKKIVFVAQTLNKKIEDVRDELKGEIAGVRDELKGVKEEVKENSKKIDKIGERLDYHEVRIERLEAKVV